MLLHSLIRILARRAVPARALRQSIDLLYWP